MTTTSSFPFSTMEVPLMDDTMEMASPYHGPADDFEIDIDVMEDQASNPDKDMTADEYMDNGENQGQDGIPDEDMIDDVAEPSMTDADYYPETNQNIVMQYEEEKTDEERKIYEAEMLEDDYDEDIDALIPEHEQKISEVPASLEEHAKIEEIQSASPTRKEHGEDNNNIYTKSYPEETQTVDAIQSKLQPEPGQTADSLTDQQPAEKAATDHVESEHPEENIRSTNETEQAEQIEPQTVHNDQQDAPEELQNTQNNGKGSDEAQSSTDGLGKADVDLREEKRVSDSNDQEPEQDRASTQSSHLHSVKVYYQDNEISLFPPREGDSSETFFIEDEGLAYESFGKLFVACREVLQNHINENEVLVIDIETLNFQLTEDSLETQKVSLKQIVDVYLHLCHNDGIEEPEALYLTLSTKLTAAAELSDLLLAANEGKGLSEIQSWEVYPDADGVSAEYEETAHEQHQEEAQGVLGNKDKEEGLVEPELESTSHSQEASNPQQDRSEAQETQKIEHSETDEVFNNSLNAEDHPESPQSSHHSEEQKTESTGTLEPLPSTNAPEGGQELRKAAESPYDEGNYEDEYHEDEYLEGDEPGDEAHPNDASEEPEGDAVDSTETHPEGYHSLESEHHEQPPSVDDAEPDTSQNNGVVADDVETQDSHEVAAEPQDEDSLDQSHKTQPVEDDSLGVTEHPKSPRSDSEPAEQLVEVDDAIEQGEVDETADKSISLPAENDEGTNLPFEEEEDYLDLGIEDDLGDFDEDQEGVSTSHTPGKRLREPDDEFDIPENTTPEFKRTRSS